MRDLKPILIYLTNKGIILDSSIDVEKTWEEFSSECFAAGFMETTDQALEVFTSWLKRKEMI